MADSFDVVVIGAGISEAASALEIALSGLRVALIDRYAPSAMASGWTLAGVRQSGRHPAESPLPVQAVKLWEGLADRLDAPTHHRQRGNLRCARDAGETAIIDQLMPEVVAMGFSGHGFCLGPLTGKLMYDFVHRRTPALPLAPLKLARFGWNGPAQPLTLHG